MRNKDEIIMPAIANPFLFEFFLETPIIERTRAVRGTIIFT